MRRMNYSNRTGINWESLVLKAKLRKVSRFVSCSIESDDVMLIKFCLFLHLRNLSVIHFLSQSFIDWADQQKVEFILNSVFVTAFTTFFLFCQSVLVTSQF